MLLIKTFPSKKKTLIKKKNKSKGRNRNVILMGPIDVTRFIVLVHSHKRIEIGLYPVIKQCVSINDLELVVNC